MNDIGSLGVILLLALLAGHLVKWIGIPEVTGYLLAGVALGPSVMGWVTPENLSALQALSEVALGLILFSIGTVFELGHFRQIGRQILRITLIEAGLAAAIVSLGLFVVGQPWPVALLLGVMAMETAAATTLMVMRESNARGPLTDVLTGIFALDNLLCLVTFNVVVASIQYATSADRGWNGELIYETVVPVVWQVVGSVALGYIVGFLLSGWSVRVVEHGEQLILLAGCVLLCVGLSKWLGVSSMITNLAVGATVVNLSDRSRRLLWSLGKTDPPLYAIFFVLAGAELNLSMLVTLGIPGAVYVLGRMGGKLAGARLGARVAKAPAAIQQALPFGMLAQAGLAVGLSLNLQNRLPQLAPAVTAVVLTAVIIFEIIGPFGVRWTIARSGEANPEAETEPELIG